VKVNARRPQSEESVVHQDKSNKTVQCRPLGVLPATCIATGDLGSRTGAEEHQTREKEEGSHTRPKGG
jgi:hypothetical protein